MIETNHQMSCDQCDDDGNESEPVHSLQEYGDISMNKFRRLLVQDKGWAHVFDGAKYKDLCPACAQKYREANNDSHS